MKKRAKIALAGVAARAYAVNVIVLELQLVIRPPVLSKENYRKKIHKCLLKKR